MYVCVCVCVCVWKQPALISNNLIKRSILLDYIYSHIDRYNMIFEETHYLSHELMYMYTFVQWLLVHIPVL